MSIFKQDASGRFVRFESIALPEIGREQLLENWIERNPHLVFEDEELAIIGRQLRTVFDHRADLLAVDAAGACVVIELKRGETPREVIAQALEYASWVDSLTPDELDVIARSYATRRGEKVSGVADLYDEVFRDELIESSARVSDRITFNARQRIVIVAERISDEVEQTLRYLRTRVGADVYAVEFSVHRVGDDTIIMTNTVVGREPPPLSLPRNRETHEETAERVQTEFLKRAVDEIEAWFHRRGCEVLHTFRSEHSVKYGGRKVLGYYFAREHMYFAVPRPPGGELDELRRGLSRPAEVQAYDGWWRFYVVNHEDWEFASRVIASWLEAPSAPGEQPSVGGVVTSG